ncbi:GDP-L-galactose phosphorylase 1-like [Olea europaea var. sylvestris]|nr:GDP-L-galactose phosphorylase 1-like [Olea europaea var. sylvestris]
MVLKRKEDYEEASEENAWRLLAEVSLSEERLHEVKELLFEAISCSMEEDNGFTKNILEDSDIGLNLSKMWTPLKAPTLL